MTRRFLFVCAIAWLTVAIGHAQPANNNFTNAWPVAGTFVITNGNSSLPANATKETGEPNHGGLVGGRSVWFKWTAPVSGLTRITTSGSSFNTLLGVYTGTAVSALSLVASNDNAPGGATYSLVNFSAVQGTTYQIAVDGRNASGSGAASGAYVLIVQMQGLVVISAPTNGTAVAIGTPIAFTAAASTPNPPVVRVDFFRAGIPFGSADSEPYTAVCYDAPLGTNAFVAIMSDGAGLTWTSAVVNIAALNVGLSILSPTNGATFLNTNPIAVSTIDFLPSGQMTNVEFFIDGQKISQTNARPFNASWRETTPGLHSLQALGTDNSGNSYTSAPISIAVARTLVRSNSVWKYLDNGSNQGTAWVAPGFDDSSWSNGPAQLGYGDGDEATVVGYGPISTNKYTTTYFRRAFEATNAASYTNLVLRVQRDDGAVAFLNGVEAARYNMPTGAITYSSFAVNSTGDEVTFFPTNAPASLLTEGTNVLAVEIHQSDPGSSDISFDLELLAVPAVPRNQLHAISFSSPTNGQVFLGASSVALDVITSDGNGFVAKVEFFADGVKLGEATNSPFSFSWDNPPPGSHVLRAIVTDDEGASVGSPVVTVRVFDELGTPVARITSPTNGAILQGPTNVVIYATVLAPGAVTNVAFFVDGNLIGEDSAAPFSLLWSNAPFGASALTVIAFDANGLGGTSTVASVIINPPADNTNAPIVFAVNPTPGASVSNLTSIQVTFSEPVLGVTALDLLVNGVAATGISGSGSNYTFTVPQQPVGPITVSWATNHGIADVGVPPLPFDETAPGATWSYTRLDVVPPTVIAKVPAANATVTNLTQVTVAFSEPVSGVDAGDFLVNGVPATAFASSTNTIYTFSFSQPYSGTINISWTTNHGIADLATTPNPFNATGAGATWNYTLDARTILVQSNANWLFIKGAAEASTPIDAWRQPTFYDSTWSNSPAPFFYGDPYTNAAIPGTLLSDMQSNYTSIYLRERFNVPNRTAVTNLQFRAQSDDGFIAWINGVEVLRYNMAAGDIPFNAVTLTSITEPNGTGAAYIGYTLPDPAGYLVEGENVLAVHAFNQSLTASSDFGFNAQLYTYLADASASAPRVFAATPTPGEVFHLTNITITFTEPVIGVDATDLLVNGVPATEMTSLTNNIYSFTFAQPTLGPVVITWDTNHGIVDLDATPQIFDGSSPSSVLHYTLLNAGVPTIAGKFPPAGAVITNLSTITVVFSKPVTNVIASDLLVNGSPADSVSGDGSNYTFIVSQPAYGSVLISWDENHTIQDLETPPNKFDPARPGGTWSYTLVDPVPAVALTAPANNATFVTPSNITISAVASDNDGFIARVEFFANNIRITEDTNAPFAITWRPAAGIYTLLAVATDNSGRTATSAPVNITVVQGAIALISSGDVWKFLDTGTDQSNAWKEVAFDDSTWASGPSELGYGDTSDGRPEATIVGFGPNANDKFTTTYFRRAFDVSDTSAFSNLTMRLVRDDGAVVYLNGVEVVRDNMPTGDINYRTFATTNVLGPDEAKFFLWPVLPASLVNGTNIIAVEMHQNFSNSADLSFDLELVANVPVVPPAVALTSPINGNLFIAPANITLRATATDIDGFVARVEFFANAGKLGESTNAPFTFNWNNVAIGGYTLRAVATDTSGLVATSAPVSIVVTDSLPIVLLRGPYLQIGTPTGGLVRWRTDVASSGVVFYGTNFSNLNNVAVQTTSTNEHIVQISGLNPATKYFYSIGTSNRTLAAGSDYWFITPPVPGTRQPTRFWVLGDPGTGNQNQRNVRDAYYNLAAASRPADIWLMLGDNAYNSGLDTEYQSAVFDMYPATLRNLFLWPAIGNHETAQSFTATTFPYLDIFSLPQNGEAGGVASGSEKFYSFDYANIHFVCLDSMTSTRSGTSPMANWLRADLAATAQDWVIAFFHHPPYTKGNHNSDAEAELIEVRQNILPILEANGVDLVLNGHSHAWERSYLLNGHYGLSSSLTPAMKIDGGDGREDGTGAYKKNANGEGVVYTVAGSSGQITGGSLDHAAHFLSLNELGSMIIDVTSNRLDAMFLTTSGETHDHFTILKALPDDRPKAPINLVASAVSGTQIALSWTDRSTNETGFVIERSTDGTNFAAQIITTANTTNALDGGLFASVTYFYRVRATNNAGASDYSNIASATPTVATVPPLAPNGLIASADDGVEFYRSQIILTWRDHATNEAGFLIERSDDGSAFLAVATVGANITHYLDRGLESASPYFYRVRAFNGAGQSAPSNLSGETTHPQSDIVLAGTRVTFHGGAEGVPPIRYQWRFMDIALSGETNESLTIPNVQPWDEGLYRVVVTDSAGRIVSNPADLFVLAPPQIVVQPAHTTNNVGTTASLSVVAVGSDPLTYRWRKNGVVFNNTDVPALIFPSVTTTNQGLYDVIVENDFGAVTSIVALLVVNTPPIAGADIVYRWADESVAVDTADLLANDSDSDGDTLSIVNVATNSAHGGVVSRNGRYVIYQPSNTFNANDTFTYTLADGRGGFASGVVNVLLTSNTPPVLEPLSNYLASVETALFIRSVASDGDVPKNKLKHSLDASVPANAHIDPDTGVLLWTPAREQAPSTNLITVRVTDDGTPALSDAKSFTVIVKDFVEMMADSAVMRAGTSNSILLVMNSSAPLTEFHCALGYPDTRLTNLTLEALAPETALVALSNFEPNAATFSVVALPGHTLQGTQQLARLHFTAIAGQHSAFALVRFNNMNCTRLHAGLAPSYLANTGNVTIIAEQPLLTALRVAGGQRSLLLYGKTNTPYWVDFTTNYIYPPNWIGWRQVIMTNLVERLDDLDQNAPMIFYRMRE